MRKKLIIAVVTALSVVTMFGCGASNKSEMFLENSNYSVANSSMEEAAYDTSDVYYTEESSESYYDDDNYEYNEEVAQSSKEGLEDRKLITTLDMSVETEDFDVLVAKIEDRVDTIGGYIENSDFYKNYSDSRSVNYTIRVPEDNLSAFTSLIETQSNILRQSKRVDDVTLSYVDLKSRKEVYITEEKRLVEMLDEAEDIDTMLSIEMRLSEVQATIESMEAQLRSYDNRCNFSTIYLNVQEVKVYTVVEEPEKTAWERISEGFVESIQDIGYGLGEFGIGFVIAIPYLILIAVIVGIIILIIRGIIKLIIKQSKKNEEKRAKERQNRAMNPVMMNGQMMQPVMMNGQMMNPAMMNGQMMNPMMNGQMMQPVMNDQMNQAEMNNQVDQAETDKQDNAK